MTSVDAVFQGGSFKPVGPVDLPENQRVRLHVEPVPASGLSADFAAWEAEDRAANEDESADDFFRTLDEDRLADRKLYPEHLKGVS